MSKRKMGLVAAAVFAVVTLAFSINFRNAFIRFDDFDYVVANVNIREGLTPRSAAWAFMANGYASNWHPLAWISHAVDNSLAKALHLDWREADNGKDLVAKVSSSFSRLVHAENVLWHAANAVLLWWLLVLLLGEGKPTDEFVSLTAAAGALLWALHPLRVEVVAWASERKELLSVFFMLLTLIAYVKGRSPRESGRYGWAIVFFVLALLAKPVAVSLPVLIFAYDWIFARRNFREAFARAVPFFGVAAVVCWLTMTAQTEGFEGAEKWTWPTKILCAVEAPVVYLQQTFWPFGLTLDYLIPDWSSWPYFAAGCILLLAIAGVCIWWLVRPNRWVGLAAFGVAWLYVGLLPMIGIVKVGYEPHSDRYTYWIGCGAVFLVCQVAVWLRPLWEKYSRQAVQGVGLLLLFLGLLSVWQSALWKDSKTLFAYVVGKTHHEHFAQSLSEEWVREGEKGVERAEEMLRDTLSFKHTAAARAALALHLAAYAEAHRPISFVGENAGYFAEARMLAAFALEDGTRNDWAYAALAFADLREKKFRSAYENMKKACDSGYQSHVFVVDLEKWKKEAEEKGDVQK